MVLFKKFRALYLLLDSSGRRSLIFLFFASLVIGVLESIAFSSVAPVAQNMLGDAPAQDIPNGGTQIDLQTAAMLLLVAFLLRSLVLIGLSFYQSRIVFQIQAALSERLLERYLNHDSKLHSNVSHLAKNVVIEAQTITQHGYLPMLAVISDTLIAVVLVSYLFYLNGAQLLLFLVGFSAILMVFAQLVRRFLYRLGESRKTMDGYRYQYVNEAFDQLDLIAAHRLHGFFQSRYKGVNRQAAKVGSRQFGLNLSTRWVIEFVIVLLGVAYLLLNPTQTLQIEQLAVSFAMVARLLPLSSKLLSNLQRLDYSGAVLKDLGQQLEHDGRPVISRQVQSQDRQLLNLSFDSVTLSVSGSDGEYFRKKVNAELSDGCIYAITGPNGVGKSTFAKAILGSVNGTIESGVLTLQVGNEVKPLEDLQALRANVNMAYVPQNPSFLDVSVRENLACGLQLTDAEIIDALKAVNLSDYVDTLPKGLDTVLGDRYGYLSGGQRQRLAIARAFLVGGKIFILDEPTSAADKAFTSEIIALLRGHSESVIVMIITHSDRIIPFCDGEISVGQSTIGLDTRNEAGE